MTRMGVPTDSLEGFKAIPAGDYEVRLDGFKPKKSKKGDSTNLNPQLKIINNNTGLNDTPVFCNLNTGAGWIQKDFVHMLGLQMVIEGDQAFIPGDWIPNQADPDNVEKWSYQGPLLGRTGRLHYAVRRNDSNKDQNYIKQFYCNIQGCTEKHETDLK